MLLAAVWGITKNRRTALRVAGYVRHRGRAWRSAPSRSGSWRTETSALGIFVGYIALILVTTGRSMDQRIALRDQLRRDASPTRCGLRPPTVPATMSLAEALDHALRGTANQPFPVVDDAAA